MLGVYNFNGPNPVIMKYGVSRDRGEREKENRRPLIALARVKSSAIDAILNNG